MASLDKKVVANVQGVDLLKIVRDDLGVHFTFAPASENLKNIQKFLLDIANKAKDHLTLVDVKNFHRRATNFLSIVGQITGFNPSVQGIEERNELIHRTELEWEEIRSELGTAYNLVKLESLDLSSYQDETDQILKTLNQTKDRFTHLLENISNLPNETESRYNDLFSNTQKNLSEEVGRMRANLDAYTIKYENGLKERETETAVLSTNFKKQVEQLSKKVEEKIAEVQQQARKFSAKEALTTYAQIFDNEANSVNKPAIRRWEVILVVLVIAEISAALSLFFFFLPEVLDISLNWGQEIFGTGLIISILFVKIFILSTIAVLISYALKSLNAQNHLYATNKFKANSLGSFQAFIEATTDDRVIDQIIKQVSIAVYSQNISGYLSKDESHANLSQKDILDFVSKTFGKAN